MNLLFLLFLFVAVWCLALRILSVQSGWAKLAEVFAVKEKVKGEYYRFQEGCMTGVPFSGALEIGISEAGLYLVLFLPFRLFHKPLFIPWEYMRMEKFKRFLSQGYRLTFPDVPGVDLEIKDRVYEKIAVHWKGEEKTAQEEEASLEGSLSKEGPTERTDCVWMPFADLREIITSLVLSHK